jgi:hypothetical protein
MTMTSVPKTTRAATRDNVTPIRRASVDTREDQLALAGHLMRQAAQAAILLVEEDEQPQIAADLLRLARDHWDSVYRVLP